MTNAVAVRNPQNFRTAQEIQAAANLIQQVMKAVMKDKIHYGTVPGCGDKPTLLKPGAEKILSTFRIACDPEIEDLSTGDVIRYRVKARGIHSTPEGVIEMGKGVGVCSSNEEKYRWRKAINKQEFEETPEDRRRKKWKRGAKGSADYQEFQVRTVPDDLENTILKMAKKRALVDLCLTATAASDCFNQDIEDLPAEYVAQDEEGPQGPPEMPKSKSAAPAPPAAPATPAENDSASRPTPEGFRLLKAKYDGLCKGCGQEVKSGSEIAYSKEKGNFHPDCVPA